MDEELVAGGLLGGAFLMLFLIWLGVAVVVIAGMWKTFVKAGKPGWAAIVPFYNIYVLLEIAGRPGWWLVLFIVPILSFVMAIILFVDIAKSFGKGTGFAVGLLLLGIVFWPILGFGDARYRGPAALSPVASI
jgi:hypothetical protein